MDPRGNLAVVRRAWEAFNAMPVTDGLMSRRDLQPVLDALDRGIVWDVTDVGIPGLGSYYGHRGVRQFLLDWFEVVGDVHTELLEARAVDEKVMCVCRQTGSGIASGAMVTWEFSMVFTMRDGKVVRMEMYADADEAREVAGLRPAVSKGV